MESTNEQLASLAKEGNKKALKDLVRRIQDQIYKVSLRMLYDPSEGVKFGVLYKPAFTKNSILPKVHVSYGYHKGFWWVIKYGLIR